MRFWHDRISSLRTCAFAVREPLRGIEPLRWADVLHFARGLSAVGRWAVPIAPLQLVCLAATATNLLMAAAIHVAVARKLVNRLLEKKCCGQVSVYRLRLSTCEQ